MSTNNLQQQLLEAGVHFGHLRKKWNPKMLPYIFAEKKGIHIIDLNKTVDGLDEAANAMKQIAKSGKKILFVATKKQAKEIISECAEKINMPHVTERWLGGMLTNFSTIRKSVKKMQSIEKMLDDSAISITKKERLTLQRSKDKMQKVLGGIENMNRTPAAVFIVDISFEDIALAEARKLGITTFGMVDTNSDPNKVDFPIPSNDDAAKSIAIVSNFLTEAIVEGLKERELNKEKEKDAEAKAKEEKAEAKTADKPEAKEEEKKEEKAAVVEAPKVEEKAAVEAKVVEAPKVEEKKEEAPAPKEAKVEEAPKVEEKKEEATVAEVKTEEAPKEEVKAAAPKVEEAPKEPKKATDNLTKIEGIGPKISDLLATNEVPTFKALADSSVDRLNEILESAGPRYKMHNPATWPEQAALARDEKWGDLEKLQDKLDGGRK